MVGRIHRYVSAEQAVKEFVRPTAILVDEGLQPLQTKPGGGQEVPLERLFTQEVHSEPVSQEAVLEEPGENAGVLGSNQ